jgi:hypothetical protein
MQIVLSARMRDAACAFIFLVSDEMIMKNMRQKPKRRKYKAK